MKLESYKFGSKNHWRRTVWNDILSRTNGAEKTNPVLYMPGPQNLDAPVAKSKGVPPDNMIGVEVDKRTVAKLRKAGVNVVHGDMLDVLGCTSLAPSAVLADFCCGMEKNILPIVGMMGFPNTRESVFMVNLQRGRDPSSNEFRALLDGQLDEAALIKTVVAYELLYKMFPHLGRLGMDEQFDELSRLQLRLSKHRGIYFIAMVTYLIVIMVDEFESKRGDPLTNGEVKKLAEMIFDEMNPSIYSYRSSCGVFMDTAILSPCKLHKTEYKGKKNAAVSRRVAAALAVRTMRRGK